jgi:hypothetical protein
VGWLCAERDRPVGSLDDKSKQREERRERKRKEGGRGGVSSAPLPHESLLFYLVI